MEFPFRFVLVRFHGTQKSNLPLNTPLNEARGHEEPVLPVSIIFTAGLSGVNT